MEIEHPVIIQLTIAYTLVGAFIFTVAITCLSLVGWVKFADSRQQNRLFAVLILEVVTIGVGSFANLLKLNPAPVVEKIGQSAVAEYIGWVALADAAMKNVEDGELEEGKSEAQELLRLAPKYPKDWNFGNAIHKGNLVLGRVALRAGDTEGAKKFLLEAGKTPGSPHLNSFGPNMTLAKELLEKGESAAVLEYFQLCSTFWEMGREKLREWSGLVKKGVVPDFGANLSY